jgi:hypothetical protein
MYISTKKNLRQNHPGLAGLKTNNCRVGIHQVFLYKIIFAEICVARRKFLRWFRILTLYYFIEKLLINLSYISFCRAWKDVLIYTISFHIEFTKTKTFEYHDSYLEYRKRVYTFFAFSKNKNQYTEMCRISCSTFMAYSRSQLRGWQIHDKVRRCPLNSKRGR